MKTKNHLIIFFLICLFFLSANLKAESTGCIKFKLKLTLENDSVIIGNFFYHGMYAFQDVHHDSISFEYFLKTRKDFNDTIKIYNNIISLKYPDLYPCKYKACLKEFVIKVALNSIKSHKVISKTICYPEVVSQFSYYGCGYRPIVITELTKAEVEMLNKKEPVLNFEFSPEYLCSNEELCVPIIVSYNKKLGKDEIIEIVKKEWCLNMSDRKNTDSMSLSRYIKLKKKFTKLNIIIFKTYYYN